MDLALDRLQLRHVIRIFGEEWIEHRLVRASRVKAPLDAEPFDRLLETEAAADHPDRAEDRGRIANNLVARAGDHVAAGRRDVLDEHQHRQLLLRGELLDAQVDLTRLHRRATGRIDDQRHRLGIAESEGALQHPREAGERHAGAQRRHRADHARQPHHRHHRRARAEARRQILHEFIGQAGTFAIVQLFGHAITSD